jgi:hypothetical protein
MKKFSLILLTIFFVLSIVGMSFAAGPSSENETKGGVNPDKKGNYSTGRDTPTGTCTSFTYSAWSTCVGGFQTRTITSSSPVGCAGGSPILKHACTPPPVKKGTAQ